MRLSRPVYRLKREAKSLARTGGIPLHDALDRIAAREGFPRWSLLAARHAELAPAGKLFARLAPGDMVLVGARPGEGKTLFALELALEAMRSGGRSVFFSLECTARDIPALFAAVGAQPGGHEAAFAFDGSDGIDADHIVSALAQAPAGTLAVIDYLQALDHRRAAPDLASQIRTLRAFALERRVILVFIAQIDRAYDPLAKPCPDLGDVRLPNPVDVSAFSKACFLNAGEIRFRSLT